MTKKKITAPLSYDPGKGRPQEYLAYLNWQEMQALQRLNGGNMERGPRGLPSFPPADATDQSNPSGTGNWTGSPNSGTTSTGAGSSSGGGSDSGSIGGSVNSGPTSTSTASSQTSSDSSSRQAAELKNAETATSVSSFNKDASRGGIASINVGPMNTPVKIGSGKISQIVKAPEATVRTVEDFYRNDPHYQAAVDQLRRQQEELRAPVVRSDSAKIAREFDPYDFMTDYEKETILNKYSPSGILSSASNVASYVYNNPFDAAKSVVNSVVQPAVTAGQYLMGDKSFIDEKGDIIQSGADDVLTAVLNYGIGTGAASIAAPRPANSVGAFVSARVPQVPEIKKAIQYADSLTQKYPPGSLTPEQVKYLEREIYDKTSRMVSQDVSGVQYVHANPTWDKIDPWTKPAIEVAQTYSPKVSGISAPKKYSEVFEKGPVNYFVPEVENLNIISDKKMITPQNPNLGYYNRSGVSDPYSGVLGKIREVYNMATGKSGDLPGPGVAINSFDQSLLGANNLSVDKLARHEIGGHYMSDISGGLYGPDIAAGPDYWKGLISEKSPATNPETVDNLAWSTYQNMLEEKAATKLEDRDYANPSWRSYGNRFSYFSPEELEDAEIARILGMYYGR